MLRLVKRLAAVAAAVTLSSAAASAQTINVDFSQAGGTSGTFSGVGAAPDAGTVWNDVVAGPRGAVAPSSTSGALLDSNGAPTAVTVSLGNFQSYDTGPTFDNRNAAFAPALLNDFTYQQVLGPGGPDSTFSISNLNPALTYDLYLYAQNGGYANTTTVFTAQGGAPQTATNDDSLGIGNGGFGAASFVLNGNYAVISGVAPDAAGTISGTFNVAEAANNAAFNGLQIVAVPEPAALSLLGFAGGLLVLRRRKA